MSGLTGAGQSKTLRRILFVAEAVALAHVARPLVLAQALDPACHEVFFLACDARYKKFFQQTVRDSDTNDLATLTTELPELANATPERCTRWRQFKWIVENLPYRPAIWTMSIPRSSAAMWIEHRGGAVLVSSPRQVWSGRDRGRLALATWVYFLLRQVASGRRRGKHCPSPHYEVDYEF